MDFLKKNTSSEDDDIFELTDIIEKGSEDASAGNSQNQAMETQMSELFGKGNKDEQPIVPDDMDADLDALLADMQPSPAAGGPARSTSPSLNVDEELEMPNMSEVDALLEGLDIPPQPDRNATSSPSESDATDLDNLLDGLLDNPGTPAPKASVPTAAQSPVVKEKIGMNLDDLDDLDALFAADSSSPAAAPTPAAAPQPTTTTAPDSPSNASLNLDDLDALFAADAAEEAHDAATTDDATGTPAPAQEEAKAAAPKKERPPKAHALSLDEELDALLGVPAATHAVDTLTADAHDKSPEDDETGTSGAKNSFADDLDELFAATADPAHIAEPAVSAASPSPKSAATKPAPSASEPEFRSLEDDLDAILGSMDAPSPANLNRPVAPLSHEPKGKDELNGEDEEPIDMSDLGDSTAATEDFLADIFDTEKDSPNKKSVTDDDLLAGLDVLDGLDDPIQPIDAETFKKFEAMQSQKEELQSFTTMQEVQNIAMISADDLADMPVMPDATPADEAEIPQLDELDKLLNGPASHTASATEHQPSAVSKPAYAAEELPNIDIDSELLATRTADPTATDDMTFATEFSDEDISRAAQELLDERVREEASLENVDTHAWISSLDEILSESDIEPTDSTDKSAENDNDFKIQLPEQGDSVNLDNLLSHLPDNAEAAHYVYSPARQAAHNALRTNSDAASAPRLPARESSAAPSSFEQSYTQELTRLQTITERFANSLSEADARIATLTQNAKSEVALEAMFRADSPFSASLQHAVRTAVASELRDHTPDTPALTTGPDLQSFAALQAKVASLQADAATRQAESAALQTRNNELEKSVREAQERIIALEDGNKEARLQTVETRLDGQAHTAQALEERCRVLEARLEEQARSQTEMEQHFHHEVEKAAAAAAARIIREEIAGILAGQ